MSRERLIKLIKTGVRQLGWPDDQYRDWLFRHTNKRSCTKCSEAELTRLADEIRRCGFPPQHDSQPLGGSAPDRPTKDQWRLVATLARELGFTGLNDPGLATLCRRVAKVEALRFLDKQGVRNLIVALENWNKSKRRKS